MELHGKDEILSAMDVVDTAFVSTAAGAKIRSRMMHYWNDESFNIYLASMKGDPKTLQITENPFLESLDGLEALPILAELQPLARLVMSEKAATRISARAAARNRISGEPSSTHSAAVPRSAMSG